MDFRRYKGSTYIGPMTGEYVVLEINGVNQFSYDLTVQRSGCEYPPQSWREMLLKADSGTPADQVWHRGVSHTKHLMYPQVYSWYLM